MRRVVLFTVLVSNCMGCLPAEYMTCISQVMSQRVSFDNDIMNVVLNITNEATLLKTCRAYQNAIPCFEQRMALCGTRAQKQALEMGKKMHSYLCAPFSIHRQKVLLRRLPCIQEALELSVDSKCQKGRSLLAKKVASCRAKCHSGDLPCLAKVEASEIAVCTVLKIENLCGIEAAQFYSQLQQVLVNNEYPIQCSYATNKTAEKKLRPVIPDFLKSPTEASMEEKIRANMKKIPNTTGHPLIRRQAGRIRTVFIKKPNSMPPATVQIPQFAPPVVITKNKFNEVVTVAIPTRSKISFNGARPIPSSLFMDQPTTIKYTRHPTLINQPLTTTTKPTPKLFQWSVPKTTGIPKDFKVPAWYSQLKANSSTTTLNPLWVYKPPSKTSIANNVIPALGTTPTPFKININWVPSNSTKNETSQKSASIIRLNDEHPDELEMPMPENDPTLPTIDLEDLSHKASRYFNAAVSAIEEKANAPNGDAWSKIAGIVGPAIQKISPNVITRLKEEIGKLDDTTTTTTMPPNAISKPPTL